MAQDLVGTLKILAALLLCSGAAGLIAGFFDGRQTGRRTFALFLSVGTVVAALQIFEGRYAAVVLVGSALGSYAAYRTWRHRTNSASRR